MKKIFLIGLIGLFLYGCATVDVVPVAHPVGVKSIFIEPFQCNDKNTSRMVSDNISMELIRSGFNVVDIESKAEAVISGVISFGGGSVSTGGAGAYVSGGYGGGGGGVASTQRSFINGVSIQVKDRESKLLATASFSQTLDTILWGGEMSPTQIGKKLGGKIAECLKKK